MPESRFPENITEAEINVVTGKTISLFSDNFEELRGKLEADEYFGSILKFMETG